MLAGMIPFIVGALGIVLFVAFRFFESGREHRFFAHQRKMLDTVTTRVYRTLVLGELPHSYRQLFIDAVRGALHSVVLVVVSVLRKIERPLSRMSHRMRAPRTKNGESRDPSAFLKTISPKKKMKKEDGNELEDSV